MKNLIFKIAVLTGTVAAFASCSDTWLMYDTSQKDKLYFKYENYPSLDQYLSTDFSFALLDESVKEVKKTVTVTLLGMPADRDRTFEVRAIHDTTSNYTTGGVQRELIDAVENEDYTIDRLIVPAGSVEGQIDVTLKRTEKIMTKTASLVLQIAQNEEFEGVPRNVYRFLISDGTAACPYWWYYSATQQWYQYTGEFRQDKYRKLLELYHGIAESNPDALRVDGRTVRREHRQRLLHGTQRTAAAHEHGIHGQPAEPPQDGLAPLRALPAVRLLFDQLPRPGVLYDRKRQRNDRRLERPGK